MKPRQIPWKWLLLGLITLLIAGLAILPRLLANSTQLASRVTDALSTWTGGEVKLTGPLRVHYFPDVSIKSGFELTNASRLPLVKSISAKDAKVSIDLVELMFGRIRIDALRLLKPEITLKEAPSLVMGPDQTIQARMANLLTGRADRRASPARRHSSTCRRRPAAKRSRRSMHASTQAPAPERCRASARSSLRDETVGFALDCGAPAETRGRDSRSGQSHLHLETARSQGHGHRVLRQRTSARRRRAGRHGQRAALLQMGRDRLAAGAEPAETVGSGHGALERVDADLRRRHLLARRQ